MNEIGVRQLKAGLSEVLRRVEEGEQIRVTVRGRPVADIVPTGSPRSEDRLRELVIAGKVTPAAQRRSRRSPRPLETGRSASDAVLSERDEGR